MSNLSDVLSAVGLTQEDLQNRIVSQICDQLLSSMQSGEDGEESYVGRSPLYTQLNAEIKKQIDVAVERAGKEFIEPRVNEMIKSTTIQLTNKYGEKQGSPKTFVEYVADLAEQYMNERVDADGKSITNSYGMGRTEQTRAMFLIDKYMGLTLKNAIEQFITDGNSKMAKAFQDLVNDRLKNLDVSVSVKTKSKA